MLKKLTLLFLLTAALQFAARAQFEVETVLINAATNGTSGQLTGNTQYYVMDDGEGQNGRYSSGYDYSYTVYGTCVLIPPRPVVIDIASPVIDPDIDPQLVETLIEILSGPRLFPGTHADTDDSLVIVITFDERMIRSHPSHIIGDGILINHIIHVITKEI